MGLTTEAARELQKIYGKNILIKTRKNSFIQKMFHAISEPIFLLLITASFIYFMLGEAKDGVIMLIFVLVIIGMDGVQEWKTDKSLEMLKEMTMPKVYVLRDGIKLAIPGTELVPGDVILVEEGSRIPADGYILSSHDFCLDESLLTGEACEVWKTSYKNFREEMKTGENILSALTLRPEEYCYAGTMVTQGKAEILIHKTGAETVYGKIGLDIVKAPVKLTPLQKQMKDLTKTCTLIAIILFLLVSFLTYLNLGRIENSNRLVNSLLSGIVLSLSMIPAEFPVILTVFLSMGAMRLTKKHALIRKLPAVETLGAVSVICVDKTGTITKNQMAVTEAISFGCQKEELLKIAGLASDSIPHDAMEAAIFEYCKECGLDKDLIFDGVFYKGYPFTQECKTMSHIWELEGRYVLAVKGSAEWILCHCTLTKDEIKTLNDQLKKSAKEGLRLIAVAKQVYDFKEEIPKKLEDCRLVLLGILGFSDPPKESIEDDIKNCLNAGIRVVMITGDSKDTAAAIAKQVHFPGEEYVISGEELLDIKEAELKKVVKKVNIFARVVPEQKMNIVNALKANGEVVAMTGDGVNDASALKYADIGIAMGLRGSEVTREAADLILLDDNFSTIIESVQDGRRIYDNIRKAVRYVFTIHIPIALICLFGPLLGILPDNLMLLPLHVVLLELIMNPTCSAALERQAGEANLMKRGPRNPKEKLISGQLLLKCLFQGVFIFICSFGSYYYFLSSDTGNPALARTIGLSALVLANLFLLPINGSEKEYAFQTFRKLVKEKGIVIVALATLLLLLLSIYSPLRNILKLQSLTITQWFLVLIITVPCVFWYDLYKFFRLHCKN
jgi:P-type Ca2+ transporter type 2C